VQRHWSPEASNFVGFAKQDKTKQLSLSLHTIALPPFMAGDQRSTTQCCVGYLTTLATWTINYIIFRNVEIFRNYFLPNEKDYCERK
jgi:hypothetical protein